MSDKLRMRPKYPWRPHLTLDEEAAIRAVIPDGMHVSVMPQGGPGRWRIHLFRDGKYPPVASRWDLRTIGAETVRALVEEATRAA